MSHTISVVLPPKVLLIRVLRKDYLLRKHQEVIVAEERYRYNYRICPPTRGVPYIGYTYSQNITRVKEEISRHYIQ